MLYMFILKKKETYALFVVIGEEYDYSSFGVFPVD
jgi:hypothetical protein